MRNALTRRQAEWTAAVRASLEAETGRTFEAWVEIARASPHGARREQLAWFKREHGLGQNRAGAILEAAFGSLGWDDPDRLRLALWTDADALAILETVETIIGGWDGVVRGQRKSYTAFSRSFQFAALAPMKGGSARLGLALAPGGMLAPAKKKEHWSERLTAAIVLTSAAALDRDVITWLSGAYDQS